MPLSGIFFVSLHHQSNRMTMFKKTDPNPQLDIFTAPSMQLGSRASKKYSAPNAWHNQFYSLVTTRIDEEIIPKEPRNQCLKIEPPAEIQLRALKIYSVMESESDYKGLYSTNASIAS